MEGSQGLQGASSSRFRAFGNEVSGASQGIAADREPHIVSIASQADRAYPNGTRSFASEFGMLDTSMGGSSQHFQRFFTTGTGSLYDESLASAFEDMSFDTRTANTPTSHRNVPLTNGHYPSGRVDVTLNQQRAPVTRQDGSLSLEFSASNGKQTSDLEHQEQARGFPSHLGKFSRSSGLYSFDNSFGVPFQPSTASASPSRKQCYVDGQSQMYIPQGQNVGSNMRQRDMSVQSYSFMQPHYVAPQMQQVLEFDFPQHRSNGQAAVCYPARGPSSSYIGTAAFQNRNNNLSCDFLHLPYGLGHQISGKLNTVSYPERMKTLQFAPSVNGYADINGYVHDHLDIQSNNYLHLGVCNPQFMSSEPEQLTYESIDEVVGRISILAMDQNHSYFLQKVLTQGTREDVDKIFSETIEHIRDLMVDPTAHSLVQKIIEKCTNDQRTRMVCEITKSPEEFFKVCCDMHGTRAMQKVIESLNTSEQVSMIASALSAGVTRLMTDANGSHVVHRCLQSFSPNHKAFLLEAAASRCLQLARDRHGCCVLQKCIQDSDDEQKNILLSKISSSALRLSEDQYGNYVIQYILGLRIEWATASVVDGLVGHFGSLSMQKCGSHVVEHCLKRTPRLMRDRIINELMNDPNLPYIMLDQYGNYVIQTALKHCQGEQHAAFIEAIRPHAAMLHRNMHGKKVLEKTNLKNKHYQFGFY